MQQNEVKIVDFLLNRGFTIYGICGLMGNLFAESGLKPNNLQNAYEKTLGYTDEEYTKAVDNGSYTREQFINDSAGYGLAQWTYWSRKRDMYDYIKGDSENPCDASIADLKEQLCFLCYELEKCYPAVYKQLQTSTSLLESTKIVLEQYEKPANMSKAVLEARLSYAEGYYKRATDTSCAEDVVIEEKPCECGCSCNCEGKECVCETVVEKEADDEDTIYMNILVRGKRYAGTLYPVD